MTNEDPHLRPTASEALEHKIFREDADNYLLGIEEKKPEYKDENDEIIPIFATLKENAIMEKCNPLLIE